MLAWQRFMIGCARSPRLIRLVQGSSWLGSLATRFVAGESLDAAMTRAKELQLDGLHPSLFFLGEYIDDPREIESNVDMKIAAVLAMDRAGGDIHVSIDPTQIGLQASTGLAKANALRIGRVAADASERPVRRIMLDMEDSGVTAPTLAIHDRMRAEGYPAAITIQAYLHRTPEDLARLIAMSEPDNGVMIRLVKGAFAEPAALAQTKRADIDHAYLEAARVLLSPEARQRGVQVAFGTHDEAMIRPITAMARELGAPREAYEFEFLLGVREGLARSLAREGERMRLYLPFGRDWWPYSARRVGENPRNALFALRALAGG